MLQRIGRGGRMTTASWVRLRPRPMALAIMVPDRLALTVGFTTFGSLFRTGAFVDAMIDPPRHAGLRKKPSSR
jgi:hypothetical protein